MLRCIVVANRYFDSVFLMSLAAQIGKIEGVTNASAMMATPANKDLMRESQMLDETGEAAQANDVVFGIEYKTEAALTLAQASIDDAILSSSKAPKSTGNTQAHEPRNIEEGLLQAAESQVLQISIPGTFVRNEALRAIDKDLHLFIFSDNVSIEEELEIKQAAQKKGLLVMGPDCGTSIINGVALGFANVIPAGPLSIIGASGTGIQEITTLAARRGIGLSQAIGLGGRDLRQEIGAISMLTALDMLEDEPNTKVLCLVSKPAHPASVEKILTRLERTPKPVVVCFLGGDTTLARPKNVVLVNRLDEAVNKIAEILGHAPKASHVLIDEALRQKLSAIRAQLKAERNKIKGLFSGGTLCDEALFLAKGLGLKDIASNLLAEPAPEALKGDGQGSNLFLDMGDDKFTAGRPHPMIDFSYRMSRALKEAQRQETAVILLDLIIGYASHPNPLGEVLPMIEAIQKIDNPPAIVMSITGTDGDPQNYSQTRAALTAAGCLVCDSNAQAAVCAIALVSRS